MPIYEYECDGCQSVFEVRQKVSDPAPQAHSCGSTQVRRILSATSFVLKGTGWYATDYGNRKETASGKDQPGASSAAGQAPAEPSAKAKPDAAAPGPKGGGKDSTPSAPSAQKAAKP